MKEENQRYKGAIEIEIGDIADIHVKDTHHKVEKQAKEQKIKEKKVREKKVREKKVKEPKIKEEKVKKQKVEKHQSENPRVETVNKGREIEAIKGLDGIEDIEEVEELEEVEEIEKIEKIEEIEEIEEIEKIEEIEEIEEIEKIEEIEEIEEIEALEEVGNVKEEEVDMGVVKKKTRTGRRRKAQEEEEAKLSVGQEILGWLLYIGIVVCVTYLIITFVGQRTEVSGESMAPTLHSGDNLIVEKITYRFNDPERYDIIVFPYQYEEGVYYIKRVIGLPGETVLIQDGEVYIDGELLGETYGAETMTNAGIAAEEIVLGENEYFVLGDNRNNSKDSRDPGVGILDGDDIVGKAIFQIWPLSDIGVIVHE